MDAPKGDQALGRRGRIARPEGGVEDLARRAHVRAGVTMTIQAPAHGERRGLPGQRHLGHRPVAVHAADAVGDVGGMVEVDVPRQVVDPDPVQRDVVLQAVANRRQHPGRGEQLGVAGHAQVAGRDAREAVRLYGCMAEAAIEPDLGDVVLVAERDGLFHGDVRPPDPG